MVNTSAILQILSTLRASYGVLGLATPFLSVPSQWWLRVRKVRKAFYPLSIVKYCPYLKGLLVTGGGTKGVELYNPVSKTSCTLPALSEAIGLHTQDGPLLCGGHVNNYLHPRKNCKILSMTSGFVTMISHDTLRITIFSRYLDSEPYSYTSPTLPQLLDPRKWDRNLSSWRGWRWKWKDFWSCQTWWNGWKGISTQTQDSVRIL